MAGFIPFLLDAAPTRAALMLLPLCFRTWRKPSLVFIALCFLFTAIGCSRPRPSVEVREWEVLSRVVEPMITVDPSRQRSKHTEDVQSELQKKGMRLIMVKAFVAEKVRFDWDCWDPRVQLIHSDGKPFASPIGKGVLHHKRSRRWSDSLHIPCPN